MEETTKRNKIRGKQEFLQIMIIEFENNVNLQSEGLRCFQTQLS
jgi:hypothetical protein